MDEDNEFITQDDFEAAILREEIAQELAVYLSAVLALNFADVYGVSVSISSCLREYPSIVIEHHKDRYHSSAVLKFLDETLEKRYKMYAIDIFSDVPIKKPTTGDQLEKKHTLEIETAEEKSILKFTRGDI